MNVGWATDGIPSGRVVRKCYHENFRNWSGDSEWPWYHQVWCVRLRRFSVFCYHADERGSGWRCSAALWSGERRPCTGWDSYCTQWWISHQAGFQRAIWACMSLQISAWILSAVLPQLQHKWGYGRRLSQSGRLAVYHDPLPDARSAVNACLGGCGSEAGTAEDAGGQGTHQVFLCSLWYRWRHSAVPYTCWCSGQVGNLQGL